MRLLTGSSSLILFNFLNFTFDILFQYLFGLFIFFHWKSFSSKTRSHSTIWNRSVHSISPLNICILRKIILFLINHKVLIGWSSGSWARISLYIKIRRQNIFKRHGGSKRSMNSLNFILSIQSFKNPILIRSCRILVFSCLRGLKSSSLSCCWLKHLSLIFKETLELVFHSLILYSNILFQN